MIQYDEAQRLFSPARMQKYLRACGGDKEKAIYLYGFNAKLSQAFFGVISLFEVVLRNSINEHYLTTLGEDWIIKQAVEGGLLEHEADEVHFTQTAYTKEGVYSHDKMIGSFTFGFWTYLFTKHNYKVGGKTLLQIFPNKAKGTTQKIVYADITSVREFRNRIAHHEPICFNKAGEIDVAYMEKHFNLIKMYLQYMGVDEETILPIIQRPEEWLKKVEELKEKI